MLEYYQDEMSIIMLVSYDRTAFLNQKYPYTSYTKGCLRPLPGVTVGYLLSGPGTVLQAFGNYLFKIKFVVFMK